MAGQIRYSEQTKAVAIKAILAGATETETCEAVGCSRATFNRWRQRYPDFNEAVIDAKMPGGQAATLARLQQRKEWAEDWLDDYLRTKGEMTEVSVTRIMPDGSEMTEKKARGKMPDLRLIDRIIGANPKAERFELRISLAEAPEDEDDDELDDEDQ